jgi:hypothetical protein
MASPNSERGANYTPLYESQHASRFERRSLVEQYEADRNCRLIVVSDAIFPYAVVFWEELLSGVDTSCDLHVMLNSPGGDGETAIRLARSAQARCKSLTVVLPDQAKSAATLLTLGAHRILMGPASDLGPVDPQFQINDRGDLVAAKDILAAVDDASAKVQAAPETYPLWASLLSDVTAIKVQQARAAIARSGDLLREALASNPDRSDEEVRALFDRLKGPLIEEPQSHGAVFDADDAAAAGLPVEKMDPAGAQWSAVWRLWAKYAVLGNVAVYESARASQIFPRTA